MVVSIFFSITPNLTSITYYPYIGTVAAFGLRTGGSFRIREHDPYIILM